MSKRKVETVEALTEWLLHEANFGGRYLGEEAKQWKADVARRIRKAVETEQQTTLHLNQE